MTDIKRDATEWEIEDMLLGYPDITIDGEVTRIFGEMTQDQRRAIETIYEIDLTKKPAPVFHFFKGLALSYHIKGDPARKDKKTQQVVIDLVTSGVIYLDMFATLEHMPILGMLSHDDEPGLAWDILAVEHFTRETAINLRDRLIPIKQGVIDPSQMPEDEINSFIKPF